MEEITVGFKSGRSITFIVYDTETFMQNLKTSIKPEAATCWYSDPKSLINISAVEYVLPTKSTLDTKGGL